MSALKTVLVFAMLALAETAQAADLYRHGSWPALASDRIAHQPGDALTIIVYENATAENSANNGSRKSSAIGGRLSAGMGFDQPAQLDMNGAMNNTATTGRSGQMIAQLSVVVDQVLPNGDLHVSGAELLTINGEKTKIRVVGRVRPADITSTNAVLSSRLAEAEIDYDGSGFVSRSAAPGIIARIFNWLGLP